jgi:5-(carboxyamino)imidazole ribonucleotide mutase
MARLGNQPDSGSNQFFINTKDNAFLDQPRDGAGYAVFGRVVSGMDVIDQIEGVKTAISAHRTPDWLFEYAAAAESRGIRVIIAGAGGAAHLPGMCASKTILPVLGVPVRSRALEGLDSLLSIVQMPKGIPVGTLAIGEAGAANAALLAAAIIGLNDPRAREALRSMRDARTADVLKDRSIKPAGRPGRSRRS